MTAYLVCCNCTQEHFTHMRVVGQFNLGFMICLLGSDLFILDQHACDEKYNFEVLQQTTTIHQQPLVRCVTTGLIAPTACTCVKRDLHVCVLVAHACLLHSRRTIRTLK